MSPERHLGRGCKSSAAPDDRSRTLHLAFQAPDGGVGSSRVPAMALVKWADPCTGLMNCTPSGTSNIGSLMVMYYTMDKHPAFMPSVFLNQTHRV